MPISAAILLQTSPDDDCSTVAGNVQTNTGNQFDSSNCQTTGKYNSVNVVSVDPGFVCNLYSDTACANFISGVSSVGCTPVVGQGVICFAQSLFDNPFALSTAVVTIGTQAVLASLGSFLGTDVKGLPNQIAAAVNQACQGNACDTTNPFDITFDTVGDCNDPRECGSTCSETITVAGTFANNDQRDYMSSLLQTALNAASQPNLTGGTSVGSGDDQLENVISFGEVVINDQGGAQQAHMTITITSQCSPDSLNIDCGSILATVTSTALGLIPDVGGVLAGAFSIGCAALAS